MVILRAAEIETAIKLLGKQPRGTPHRFAFDLSGVFSQPFAEEGVWRRVQRNSFFALKNS